ncbi:hypothetical protein PFLUV_G00090680 [Perca fluviatilis]|uniref:UPAR/Ly6 domain-containing protein n=1 Tax=Perca fluviatilis TaxID=8168 RepID=A0A6A5F599_PERFL|nr:hypothetical protein PFLUV_G00090680 [Perca fluviatilis]
MCGYGIKSYLVPSLLLVSVAVGSEVKESHAPYPCCKPPTIEFNERCNTSWSAKNKTFAISNGASTRCFPPCMKMIEDGQMTVDECVNISATVVCSDENNVVAEERIYYYIQPCSDSPSDKMATGNQGGSRATGSVGLLLLALVIAGLNVK